MWEILLKEVWHPLAVIQAIHIDEILIDVRHPLTVSDTQYIKKRLKKSHHNQQYINKNLGHAHQKHDPTQRKKTEVRSIAHVLLTHLFSVKWTQPLTHSLLVSDGVCWRIRIGHFVPCCGCWAFLALVKMFAVRWWIFCVFFAEISHVSNVLIPP